MQGYIEIRHIEIPSPEFLGPFTSISTEVTTSESKEKSEAVPLADLTPLEDPRTDNNNEEETSFAKEHTRALTEEDKELDNTDEGETEIEERGYSSSSINDNSDIPVIVIEEVEESDGGASEPEQKRLWRNSQVLEEDQEGGLPKMAVALISRRSRHRAG